MKKYYFFLVFVLGFIFLGLYYTGLGFIDKKTDEFFDANIKKAAISYASLRGLNSVVSIVAKSNLQVSPAGVGVELAFGQILDPLDDLTQRVSTILVWAIVALGIEKVAFEILSQNAFFVLAILAFVLSFSIFLNANLSVFLAKILAGLLVLRLLLPISAFVSFYAHQEFFDPNIQAAKENLSLSYKIDSQKLLDNTTKDQSFLEKIKNSYSKLDKEISGLKDSFLELASKATSIIDALISIGTMYVFAFLLDVIILPLAGFFVMYKGLGLIFTKEFYDS